MASNWAREQQSSPLQAASASSYVEFQAIVNIGSTGAPTIAYKDAPCIAVSRTGTGAYTLAFPKGKYGIVKATLISPAGTVRSAYILTTTTSGSAGAATIITVNASGVATDPASGDVMQLEFKVLG